MVDPAFISMINSLPPKLFLANLKPLKRKKKKKKQNNNANHFNLDHGFINSGYSTSITALCSKGLKWLYLINPLLDCAHILCLCLPVKKYMSIHICVYFSFFRKQSNIELPSIVWLLPLSLCQRVVLRFHLQIPSASENVICLVLES